MFIIYANRIYLFQLFSLNRTAKIIVFDSSVGWYAMVTVADSSDSDPLGALKGSRFCINSVIMEFTEIR